MRTPGVLGTALLVGIAPPAAASAPPSEDGLAYHGSVAMTAGRVDVHLTPRNHGPHPVTAATLRLRWSAPLTDRQELPPSCARSGTRALICETGPLPADAPGDALALHVRLQGTPSEVVLQLDTIWRSDTPADRHHPDDPQRVLALDTGDAYFF
ncbi:hypothetical protein ACFU53_21215 [Streptomyces sp. NPDC057474]|uniref:hypothetical protein n=1 Tax=Streptomyces sp. NPDC057474 TaxID=3346144 RepID=UPI0036AF537C